ncbi:MAG: GNAT family N-acetyltransferase [Staphylococcus equorum]|nr:GNAT family N-acetyltransferase [Staphylococcus equorum]MDN6736133.1 GNAT family N-acetyltransferase [Tetragenococcus koreensis]
MIEGEKIYLRPIENDDINKLNKWKNDAEVFKYLGGGFMPVSIIQQEKWLESMSDLTGKNKRFMICEENEKAIGMIGLYDINWIHRTCEIGIYLGEKEAWGKGYSKESYQLIESFAREYLNLRKIKLYVVSDNTNAVNMWNSLDFIVVGEHFKERFIEGKYRDVLIMEKFIS